MKKPINKIQIIDKFNLERFLQAQEHSFHYALEELKARRKRSHWIWYVFPQLKGLGLSSMTLFDLALPDDVFAKVLEKYFEGRRCGATLRILPD